jgi:hypothetical protein
LIIRALTLTMDAAGQTSYAAQRLREEARDNRVALDRAALRMRRGLYARPSAVGEAALGALQAALALVDADLRLYSVGPDDSEDVEDVEDVDDVEEMSAS